MFSPDKRSAIMRAVKSRDTRPENLFARLLAEAGIPFESHPAELPGKPDFLCREAGCVVFMHGCFWHGHERCRKGTVRPVSNATFWSEKIAKNRRRDARVARKLRAMGYGVLTVWECEIRRSEIPGRVLGRLSRKSGSEQTIGDKPLRP